MASNAMPDQPRRWIPRPAGSTIAAAAGMLVMIASAVVLRAALLTARMIADENADRAGGALASLAPWNLAQRHPSAAALVMLLAVALVAAVALTSDRFPADPLLAQCAMRRALWCAASFAALYAGTFLQLLRASADWPIGSEAQQARRLLFVSVMALWVGLALLLAAAWRRQTRPTERPRNAVT